MSDDLHNDENFQQPKEGEHFVTGMIMGLIIGGVLAYVYSSPSGKKKAQQFIDESGKILENLKSETPEFKKRAKDLGQKALDLKNSLADQVQKAYKGKNIKPQSISDQIKQRFFKKNGKKLSK